MARQYQSISGFVNETGNRQYQSTESFRNETSGSGSALTLNLVDTISFSDAPIMQPAKVLSDSITLAEAIAKLTGKTLSDSIAFTDAFALITGKAFSDPITVSDAVAFLTGKTLSDAITVSDAIANLTGKTFSDSLAVIDALALLSGKSFVDTLSLADSVVKGFSKGLSDSITVTDSISATVLLTSALADAFRVSDSILLLLTPGSAAAQINLPALGICSDTARRTTPATQGCYTPARRTAPPVMGCAEMARRTGFAETGCSTVTRRTTETETGTDIDPDGPRSWTLALTDFVTVSDSMRLIGTFIDPPEIEGCTDEFPGAYWGTYLFDLLESQDPNVELTGQQIACAVELLLAQLAASGEHVGKTLGIMFWRFDPDPANGLSLISKADSDNCDPANPEGNFDVEYNSGHWTLAIAVCVNS